MTLKVVFQLIKPHSWHDSTLSHRNPTQQSPHDARRVINFDDNITAVSASASCLDWLSNGVCLLIRSFACWFIDICLSLLVFISFSSRLKASSPQPSVEFTPCTLISPLRARPINHNSILSRSFSRSSARKNFLSCYLHINQESFAAFVWAFLLISRQANSN
jgi:hypothetical protein